MKKKPVPAPVAEETSVRTVVDYETLRQCITEGSEKHSNIEQELALFITSGAAAWIRLCRDGRETEQTKQTKPHQRYCAGNLTVLLANIIES